MHDVAPFARPTAELGVALTTDLRDGLDDAEATARLTASGPNELPPPRRERLAGRIFRQVREPMALLLIGAATTSGVLLGDIAEAIAISAIVVLNAVIAILQETKAQQALDALRELESPSARVIRTSTVRIIPAKEVVLGDVILLHEGDLVPADARLVSSDQLRCDESMLTGESLAVEKDPDLSIPADTPVADRLNMVFSGSLVSHGSGRAIVTAIASDTEIGTIAGLLSDPKKATPLQTELAVLTKRLGTIAIVAAAAALGLILLRNGTADHALEQGFLAAVALAVAAVPEGLATVVTVALAMGVSRMAARGAIVRRLPAVETLGATDVIATDKTGTLTLNQMNVVSVWTPEEGSGAQLVAALCNDAYLEPPSGDPLEIALLRWVGRTSTEALRGAYEVESKEPFDSDRKMMSVVVRGELTRSELVKGAPESVLPLAPGAAPELNDEVESMTQRGLKVIALAARSLDQAGSFEIVGIIGLGDPIRPETADTVKQAHDAGVRLLMVTGDHPQTARAIAAEAGLPHQRIMNGRELSEQGMPPDPMDVDIYARATPQQKLDLVDALRADGHVVAVTGDGVNDAPALHHADIGVAMGRAGTEVARQASDLVITDDNLATVIHAVQEGRGIYDNIRKVVEYLVAANISEILVVLVALVLFPELGVPLLPLQLLWINLITDGLPAIALGVDPVNPGLMQAPPRRMDDPLLNGRRLRRLLARGGALAAACMGALAVARFAWDEPWTHARMTMFTTLAISQLAYAFAVHTPWRGEGVRAALAGTLTNRWLLVGAGGGLLLQVLALSWEPSRDLLGGASLSPREWGLVALAAVIPSIGILTFEALKNRSEK